jgi:hypothetical protein
MRLTGLAHELQLTVFKLLNTFDDAYHLVRCCKKLNALFQETRYIILQSIIVSP